MDSGIGASLRDARNRRKIELSEVEAATQIRIRYLRAIENEEWDVLPGGVYTRSFIRTYSSFLGLDGERLAEDFRRDHQTQSGERPPSPQQSPGTRRESGLPQIPGRVWAILASAALIAAAIVIGLSGGSEAPVPSDSSRGETTRDGRVDLPPVTNEKPGISVRLAATAEVWVCVLDAGGRRLVDGAILESGATEGPFRSGSFTVSFGNGEVSMRIDGKQADIPATSSPIGYAIDSQGQLTELSESERPTCT